MDVPVQYHEEVRVSNGVLVMPGANWDASRNVLTTPFKLVDKTAGNMSPGAQPIGQGAQAPANVTEPPTNLQVSAPTHAVRPDEYERILPDASK